MIKKLADDKVKFNLAVSLHSAIQEKREQIMPFATKFTLIDLKESLQYWYEKTNQRITYEYVIWEGINDTREDIDALIRYCKQVPCKVNLIEYNAIDDDSFKQASKSVTDLDNAMIGNHAIFNGKFTNVSLGDYSTLK